MRDATPTWAIISKLADDVSREQAWLWDEIHRRDAVLAWLEKNAPDALRLCPYKVLRAADTPATATAVAPKEGSNA